MSNKFKISILIHNFGLKIFTNDKDIFDLVKSQLSLSVNQKRQKPKFDIVFNLRKVDYRKIPQTKADIFQQYPLFQDEYSQDNKIILNAGLRTIRIYIEPENNKVDVFVASGQEIDINLLFDLILFQPLRFLLGFHKLYFLHSSCVARDSNAILFSGQSESGKSVLCLSLIRSGFNFISDDDTLLRQKGKLVECLSFPFNPKIKDRLVKYFPEIKNKYLKNACKSDKKKIEIQKIYPGCLKDKAIPRLIIFPQFSKTAKTKILPLAKDKALSYLIKNEFRIFSGKYENVSKGHFALLSDLVKQVRTYQLFYQDKDINKIPKIINEII
jgi:hypothetical protein